MGPRISESVWVRGVGWVGWVGWGAGGIGDEAPESKHDATRIRPQRGSRRRRSWQRLGEHKAAAVATAELVVYNRERVFLSIVCVRSYLVLLGRSPAFLALKTELLDALVHRRTAALATPAGVPSIHLLVFQEVDNLKNRWKEISKIRKKKVEGG